VIENTVSAIGGNEMLLGALAVLVLSLPVMILLVGKEADRELRHDTGEGLPNPTGCAAPVCIGMVLLVFVAVVILVNKP
jgi:hypothetical protein